VSVAVHPAVDRDEPTIALAGFDKPQPRRLLGAIDSVAWWMPDSMLDILPRSVGRDQRPGCTQGPCALARPARPPDGGGVGHAPREEASWVSG